VYRHVEDQLSAFAGRPVIHVPEQHGMMDLLIGAYVWGLLDGCLHSGDGDAAPAGDPNADAAILAAAAQVFPRLFGAERALWLRRMLPQWEGRSAQHQSFKRALDQMSQRGAADSRYLAAADPLRFARASGLLRFLLQTPQARR
jgi:hypothetical protein